MRRLEPTHDLLAFPGQTVGVFDPVVQTLVRPMVGVWSDDPDLCDVATKLVRHDHARLAKLPDQPEKDALCSLRVATCLN